MFYSIRLPGFGRTDCTDNGCETAGEHHRHAPTDAHAETEGHQTGMGAWPD